MAKTILVVEDDQNISELLRLYLEKEGYTVNIADDGGKGVELYRRLKPDLVLLDLMLPVLDGWGVLRAIRQDGKTPVIMLTAARRTPRAARKSRDGSCLTSSLLTSTRLS